MDFAIIIPTAGRIDDLDHCLRSIQQCSIESPIYNVFVVDNNTDGALSSSVRELCEQKYRDVCAYIQEPRPGLTAARHKAIEISDADVFCYVDDDVSFTPQWFRSTCNAFADPSVALAGGPTLPRFTSTVPSWFWDFFSQTPYGGWCCGWLSLLDIGKDVDGIHPNWIWGLNFAIRKDVLIDCGGFHLDLVPKQYMRWQGDGETGLTMKIAEKGYKAVYRQDSLLFHHCGADRLNADYFVKRAYYQGVCNSFTALRPELLGNVLPKINPAIKDLKTRLRHQASNLKNRFLVTLLHARIRSPWAEASAEIRARCQEAEQRGYAFHQEEALNDSFLQEWIKRPNYFDVDLRLCCKS